MATLKPIPGSPSKLSPEISQSSKIILQVDEPLMPNLSSFLPSDKPFVGFGTTNAEIPLCFLLLSLVARTTVASDS